MKPQYTITDAFKELDGINNKIGLFTELRDLKVDLKASSLKELIVSGGKFNNNPLLDGVIKRDEYTDKLNALYLSKVSYEKFIWEEIKRLKDIEQGLVIAFLKDYMKLKWNEITIIMNYSDKQCRRYYNEYKEKY